MSFLQKIGLGRKKKEMIPLLGDKMKKEQEAYSIKYNPYLRGFIFLFFRYSLALEFSEAFGRFNFCLNLGGLKLKVGSSTKVDLPT